MKNNKIKCGLVHSSEFVVRSLMLVVALTLLPMITYAANNVYYSVGQNTNNHMSGGSPTISILGGTATFSEAQTENDLGVGDEVDYDSDNKKCYLVTKIDTSHWTVVTNTGVTAPDTSGTKTLNSIKHCFDSLSAALPSGSGGAKTLLGTNDLTSGGGYILNIACYNDAGGYDSAAVTIDGWTTGPNNYIRIYTPTNTSTECNQRQRHSGKWDTNKYRLETTDTCILINEEYSRIEGLQAKATISSASYENVVGYSPPGTSGEFRISHCIIQASISGNSDSCAGIRIGYLEPANRIAKIWNNIIYNIINGAYNDNGGIYCHWGNTDYIYNNTIQNCNAGIFGVNGASNKTYAINNITQNCSDGFDFSGGFPAECDYNISDIDGDAPGPNSRNGVTVLFVNAANKDFHLSVADSGAKDYGTPLSNDTNLAFSDDIDGQSRHGARVWDIGADEFIAKASLGKGVIRKAVIR
jgi:hypothetical protein